MKKISNSLIAVCISISLLTAFHAVFFRGNAAAEEVPQDKDLSQAYEELHLLLDVPDHDPNNLPIITFRLVDVGGAFHIVHLLLVPVPTIADPDYKPIIMSGTGQVVELTNEPTLNPSYYMNLYYSQEHAENNPSGYWHDGRIGQISLDLVTLQGTFWMVGTDHNATSNEEDSAFDKFNVTLHGDLPHCITENIAISY
jgi:hypothetical protein